ncbi:FecR domain-containing protein [Pedobacter steynii]|uniref:FecR family protein n=1 Tax=Pedobacter steynii TaxID=430522 RepID=UPI00155DD091|nr:FecR domain-containing protein [Pedobacter steynii]NQX42210.1 FecR domain-containing protein [Pedobacter steynii]
MDRISDCTATDEEIALYNACLNAVQSEEQSWDESILGNKGKLEQAIFNKISAEIQVQPVALNLSLWKKIMAAATIVLISGISLYFYRQHMPDLTTPKTEIVNDVKPGANQAVLTLANGKRIVLNASVNGEIAEQSGIRIRKTADGQLIYTLSDSGTAANSGGPVAFNTIETPKGGQYQINLPDGTRVWLNAASSLKYPVRFDRKERKVSLQGEGYFEVAKDKHKPFKVNSGTQELEVLGTHFNINSYADEPSSKTTLLEGAVRLFPHGGQDLILSPGQQAVLASGRMKVAMVDPEEVLAWKNGNFVFNDEGLETIMRKISRWYDVEVSYQRKPADLTFTGVVSRSRNISAVLNALDKTGKVHFKVEGKKVTVW